MTSTRVTPNCIQLPVDLVGSSSYGRYSKVSAAKTFNMFISSSGPVGENPPEQWMINFPGYRRILNLLPYPDPYPNPPLYPDQVPVGEGRGIFLSIRGNFAVVVVNSVVYTLSPTLTQTTIGSINTSSGEVYIAENLNNQICIVDGIDAWIYNYSLPAPNLVKQTDGPLGTGALIPGYVEYHNTYFLFGNANFTIQNPFWYAFQFNSATGASAIVEVPNGAGRFDFTTKADYPLAVKRVPGRSANVIVFGTSVCEIWTNTGGPGKQNYTKNVSIGINYGCQSVATIAEGGDLLAWLGINQDESPAIMTYDGNEIKSISTDGIEFVLGELYAPETSTAILFRQDGHLVYQLTFYDPRDNMTLVYDFDTELFFNLSNQSMDFHPARNYIYFNLKTYFISLRNASLYELSSTITVYDENLPVTSSTSPYNPSLVYEIPHRRVVSNIRQANSTRFVANSLVVTLEQGCDDNYTGISNIDYLITEDIFINPDDPIITEQGQPLISETSSSGSSVISYVPRIDLRISKDGGVTWSNFVSRTLHPLGHRQNILHWEGMGVANDLTLEFQFHQTNRLIVNQAVLDIII